MPISVVLIDDHHLIREGLRRAFEGEQDCQIVGEGGTVAEAISQSSLLKPDVSIIDVRLPDGSGLDAVRTIRAQHPMMGLVVLTMYAGDEQLFAALEAGASAFVPKNAPAEDVILAARHAAAAPRSFSAADLADAMRRRQEPRGPQLSPREREVLQLLADGFSVSGISKAYTNFI